MKQTLNASTHSTLRTRSPSRKTACIAACLLVATLSLAGCSPTPPETSIPTTHAEARTAMTAERMGQLILQVDPDATLTGSTWRFEAAGYVVAVVFDATADRMRILIPVGSAKELTDAQRTRLLQANFDSALDARYAIAQDLVWGAFIHPLSLLTDEEFLLGLGQTVSVVETFGDTYSSGMFTFGAGDSAQIQREKLLDFLRKQET